jgi:hypothetical protein
MHAPLGDPVDLDQIAEKGRQVLELGVMLGPSHGAWSGRDAFR